MARAVRLLMRFACVAFVLAWSSAAAAAPGAAAAPHAAVTAEPRIPASAPPAVRRQVSLIRKAAPVPITDDDLVRPGAIALKGDDHGTERYIEHDPKTGGYVLYNAGPRGTYERVIDPKQDRQSWRLPVGPRSVFRAYGFDGSEGLTSNDAWVTKSMMPRGWTISGTRWGRYVHMPYFPIPGGDAPSIDYTQATGEELASLGHGIVEDLSRGGDAPSTIATSKGRVRLTPANVRAVLTEASRAHLDKGGTAVLEQILSRTADLGSPSAGLVRASALAELCDAAMSSLSASRAIVRLAHHPNDALAASVLENAPLARFHPAEREAAFAGHEAAGPLVQAAVVKMKKRLNPW